MIACGCVLYNSLAESPTGFSRRHLDNSRLSPGSRIRRSRQRRNRNDRSGVKRPRRLRHRQTSGKTRRHRQPGFQGKKPVTLADGCPLRAWPHRSRRVRAGGRLRKTGQGAESRIGSGFPSIRITSTSTSDSGYDCLRPDGQTTSRCSMVTADPRPIINRRWLLAW